jgi:hypothetical protein
MTAAPVDESRLTDAALLLALWRGSAEAPREDLGDRLRLMKLAFVAQHTFVERRIRALDLSFYRWSWGPLSNGVYAVWKLLQDAGYLAEDEHFILTRAGEGLADAFHEEVLRAEANRPVWEVVSGTAEQWRGVRTAELLDYVYDSQLTPAGGTKHQRVRDISKGVELLQPLSPEQAKIELQIDPAWVETLGLLFQPGSRQEIARAEQDFRLGRFQVLDLSA